MLTLALLVVGFAWLMAVLVVVGLCRNAARGDRALVAPAPAAPSPRRFVRAPRPSLPVS